MSVLGRLRGFWFALLALVGAAQARGDHFSGADITYECVGPNQYRITLDLFLDCAGAPLIPQSLNFTNNCGVSFSLNNLPLVQANEVSQLCGSQLLNSTCNGGTQPGVMHYQFQTTLFLSPCNSWTISWATCCRAVTNNIQLTPGLYVAATLNNLGGLCDQSPQFGDMSIPYVCVGTPVSYNPQVTDADGNTMVYSLISARFGAPAPTNVTYQPGFTATQPIPGFTLDTSTGQINFTPTITGQYVVALQVATYNASGQLIGTVMRDFLFIVIPCTDPPANNVGATAISSGFITSATTVEMCDGVPSCVDLTFTDVDPLAVITLTSQVAAQLPGSTFTVNGSNPAVATLCWTPVFALSPVTVIVDVNDNACPLQNLSNYALTITVVAPPAVPPNAGTPAVVSSCPGTPPMNLFAQLGGAPQAGGTWIGPNGVHGGTFNPATDPFGVYTYTVGNGCQNASATVTVNQAATGSAGTNGTLTICSSSSAVALINSLGGSPSAGGTWNGPSPVVGGLYNPSTMNPGVYTYTVINPPPCANASATVTVTENAAANAGTNGTLTVCSNGAAQSLFAALGGTPQAGGAWSGPSPVVGGNYDPATMDPGAYTYTVTGVAPCTNASATVTVTENAAANAGTNGTLTVCSNGAAQSLFAALGGTPQAGGAWSGPSPVVGGNYDPATMAPGAYTYTVTGVAPCANASATVTVTENAAANAGTNGTLTVCSDGAAQSLFAALGGTPQAGGAWSGPSPVVGGSYDPATMAPGAYTYTVTGVAPCANASATVTVTENAAPSAGTNGTLTVCSNGAAQSLFAALGGTPQAGGAWSGPSPVVGGNYDPATMAPGAYTYTVTGVAPCANASATVTVTENAAANAGTNGTLTVCDQGAAQSLFAALGGTPQAGGAWSGPSPVVGGSYDPATMAPGAYTYTVTGVAPCANASATVTVTENAAANAGTNGTLTVCSDGAAVSLLAQLGGSPDAGGAWSGPSAVVGGNYDPATMAPGAYTYTVTGAAPCASASATVTVAESSSPNAGTNGAATVCGNGAAISLLAQLGGSPDAGGTWSGPSPVVGGSYDPATMDPGVYTYTLAAAPPCVSSSATVTITENAAADAGTSGTLTVCDQGAAQSLFAALGGTPQAGGAWSGPSPVVGGNYDPATMAPGAYTYTVTGAAPCASASATVTVAESSSPNAGTNGAATVCGNGAAISLLAQLGGSPDAGGTWSGPSPVVGGSYDPATMDPGVYTYTLAAAPPCVSSSATVTITENAAADAGTSGTLTVCDQGAAQSLFAALGGTPQAGGAWSGPSPVVGGNYDPATMAPGAYTYTVTGVAPCANVSATVTVTENAAPNAGTNGTLTVCSNGAAQSLFAALGGTPQAGGAWSGPSPVVGGNYDPATMAPGAYTYTVTGVAPCANASATVTVTENAAANAGTNGTLTVCSDGAAVSLLAQLGGSPDAGGAWSGPSPVVGGNYDPATMAPGAYTYTVTGVAPCANASATVTVTENAAPSAGTNGTLTVCSNGAAQSLFAALGGTPQAGGAWSGPSPVVGGSYDPATMAPGAYTYTVTGVAPCANASATVTVTENAAPSAGTNGALTVCSDGAAVSLLAQLGGTPQAGGAWSGPSPVVGGSYDPATMAPGAYTYTVTGAAPCASASATVTVAESSSPNAGTNGAATVCGNGAAISLLAQLGGSPDAGGTWSGPSPVVGGSYDPATMDPGVYTYTLAAAPPCVSSSATVTITENAAADAGTSGTLTVCDQGAAQSLFAALGGTPQAGGAWSGPSPVVGGNYDPVTMAPGAYTYTVTGAAPCASASATVTVAESSSPNAGTNGALTVCSDGAAISLLAQLGGSPDAGGAWSGPSPVVGGSYDPATMDPGVYTYTLAAAPPCVSSSATVTITENAAADAGTSGTLTVCDQGAAQSLFAALGGTPQAGGAWSGPSPVVGGNYDPATMAPGAYTYTVTGAAPCASASATVTVAESSSPNAGTNGAATVCGNGAAISLLAQLGGSPDAGGTWSGPSPVVGGSYDPATMDPGVYTYTLAAAPPCVSSSATVTITENAAADAGTSGTLTVCDQGAAQSLFAALGGTPQAGGAWSGPSPVVGGNYDPVTMAPGAYTYTVTGAAPCASASATVTVAESSSPNAGTNGALTVCSDGAAISLLAQLGGSPDAGGTWSGPSPVVGGSYDPATMDPGVYTYTLPAVAPCAGAVSQVVIAEEQPGNAGTSSSIDVCTGSGPVDLFALLGGAPQAGGTWSHPDGTAFNGVFDPASDPAGAQVYSVPGVACPSSTSVVTVNLLLGPNAGGDSVISACSTQAPFSLTAQLPGAPDVNGTWTDSQGSIVADLFNPGTQGGGVFVYTVPGSANCPDDQAQLTVIVNAAPLAGISGSLTFCANGSQQSLFDGLSGTLDAGGTWTAPSGAPHGTILNPSTDAAGDYTYTVSGIAPCPAASSTVTVVINPVPEAGEDGSLVLCTTSPATSLFAALGGDPQAGGAWSGPGGSFSGTFDPLTGLPGVYTYTVSGTAPCSDDAATVTVSVTTAGNAGTGASLVFCPGDSAVDLFSVLGGDADSFGQWAAPDGSPVSSVFDPATGISGPYTYTVTPPNPCPQVSAVITITVVGPAVADFTLLSDGQCVPLEVGFAHGYTGPGTCTWIIGSNPPIEQCAPFTFIFDQPGSYDVTLIVDAGNGCGADTVTVADAVTAYAQPHAAFDMLPESITTLQPVGFFSNTTTGANAYEWLINDRFVSDETDLRHTFPAQIGDAYGVCLVAYASAACADTACRTITLEDGMVLWVPNTFTPNGDDKNEGFAPVVLGIDPRFYRFEVFDRWGLRVFLSETPGEAWDGRHADGTEAPVDVYVWQVRVKDAFSGDRVERSGHVTLLR